MVCVCARSAPPPPSPSPSRDDDDAVGVLLPTGDSTEETASDVHWVVVHLVAVEIDHPYLLSTLRYRSRLCRPPYGLFYKKMVRGEVVHCNAGP